MNRTSPAVCVAALVVAVAACGGSSDVGAPLQTGSAKVPIGLSPQRGPADAWVTVVEFSDFECPFCGREEPVLSQLLGAYPADLRLVYKHFPLSQHADAVPAAVAAECAGDQGKFWEMHDLLFAHQTALGDQGLASYAAQLEIDVSAWQLCRTTAGGAAAARVQADQALGNSIGIAATPTLVVNGAVYPGAYSLDSYRPVVDAAIASAKASGVPRAQYYETVVLGN
ncbi:MAG TPA: thioredoxin domain-containing protein [Anaeromyxobacteraceae bacterium]